MQDFKIPINPGGEQKEIRIDARVPLDKYTDSVANAKTISLALSVPGAENHTLQQFDYRVRIRDSATVHFTLYGRRYFIVHSNLVYILRPIGYPGTEGRKPTKIARADGVFTGIEDKLEAGFIIGRTPALVKQDTYCERKKSGFPAEHFWGPKDTEGDAGEPLPNSFRYFLDRCFPESELQPQVGSECIWEFDGAKVEEYLTEGVAVSQDTMNQIYRGLEMLFPEKVRQKRSESSGYWNAQIDKHCNKEPRTPGADFAVNFSFVYTTNQSRVGYSPISKVLWASTNPRFVNEDEIIQRVETMTRSANPSRRRTLRKLPDILGQGTVKFEDLPKDVYWFGVPVEDVTSLAKLNKSETSLF